MKTLRHTLLPLLLLPLLTLCLLHPAAQAKPDIDRLLGGLVEAGNRALQAHTAPADTNAPADTASTADETDKAFTFRNPLEALQENLSALKETYKEEGRAYARELGDIMVERVMSDKKVDNTLDSVRALCWGVVIYITIISLLLFGMMLRINTLLARLNARDKQ